ncbi:MAG TPA: hypothetical protein VN605_05575 [Thermoanaerobaculia bacterium]|nr:hypothetical protein [Thermoanaerobaculia bacterium]
MTKGSPLLPEQPKRHRVYRGLTDRQEHIFTWIAVVVVLLFVTAWVAALQQVRDERDAEIAEAKAAGVPAPPPVPVSPTRQITTAILDSDSPSTAYINDAMLKFLDPLRGYSGSLRFTTQTPGSTIVPGAPEPASAVLSGRGGSETTDFLAPAAPGVYSLAVKLNEATKQIDNFNVITLVPFSQKRNGRIGLYYLGSWPFEGGGKPKTAAYANPSGFIEVTKENQDTQISEHFRLRDFLTKTQYDVWPKYLLLNPKLLDKLELTIQELEASGHPVTHVQIMSGFRTPQYNHTGGNVAGRANLSRHMYGDASDIFVDNDRNGMSDDLNHDGRVDTRDADVVGQAAERVERKYPALVGGVGVYSACCGHGPFTHIDVRGFRARWRGTGNG